MAATGTGKIARLLNAIFHPPEGLSDTEHRTLIIDAITDLHDYINGLEQQAGMDDPSLGT